MRYSRYRFDWTIKAVTSLIKYRKAYNIDEIDEIFCSIIRIKGNIVKISDLAILLGFDLIDLAENDIFNSYLENLIDYDLILIEPENGTIQLTVNGINALNSKLKYKFFYASTELLKNQALNYENFDFSFKNNFDLENKIYHLKRVKEEVFEDIELKNKIQSQLFQNNIFNGEVIELYDVSPKINYQSIPLEIEISKFRNNFQISISKSGVNKSEIQKLIELPQNSEFKESLIKLGIFNNVLKEKSVIIKQDIVDHLDLWNWKELAENPRLDWNDTSIFEFFIQNGDSNIWNTISEKAPLESIKSVINKYSEYWNWTELTQRFDDDFIKDNIENFDWDFEELSIKEPNVVINYLSNENLKDRNWDWNYLSRNLPDKFIEDNFDLFPWDYHLLTEFKSDILRNQSGKDNYTSILLSKPWNWKFISSNFDINFLYNNLSKIADEVEWHIVLDRFFSEEKMLTKFLNNDDLKKLLRQHLPDDFVVAHQKYYWTNELIIFFEEQNLIQWETKNYIKGFDTNKNVVWNRTIFEKYWSYVKTESGFFNVSNNISDFMLIEEYSDFSWNWEGISQNKRLLSNPEFVERAFIGELSFSNKLFWNQILSHSNFEVSFWNKNLEAFFNPTENIKQIQFWETLTKKEKIDFVIDHKHFPWDWNFISDLASEELILRSFNDLELLSKWNWNILTRKFNKEFILNNLDKLNNYIDWVYVINDVFKDEFIFENSKLNIARRISNLEIKKKNEIWRILTSKYTFDRIYQILLQTFENELWNWDWDYISINEHFPTDITTLNLFENKINWDKFSSSKSILKKFTYNKNDWTYQDYLRYIKFYLTTYYSKWNWGDLSKISDLNYNREIIFTFRELWDWNYLSEFGGFLLQKKKDTDDYLKNLLHQYPEVNFSIVSKRSDIKIDSNLIHFFEDKNWDWQVLSENKKAEITDELILELKDKNWNWQAISRRLNMVFSNEILILLNEKNWDWDFLSNHENLDYNIDFIEKTNTKPWNWKAISRHKSFLPTDDILTLVSDYDLDWEHLSLHPNLKVTEDLLSKFENKWNWKNITRKVKDNFDDISFVDCFKEKWDWQFICESGKMTLNSDTLNKFKDYLNWDLISSNTNINFSIDIIQTFKSLWNWSSLKDNKRVQELLGNYVKNEINNNPHLLFCHKIEQQNSKWKGRIYHFSHIDNAIQIIREKKIKSRKTANQLSDSAGDVVNSRTDVHAFARFYYRPHTQTQFYNEFLGIDVTNGFEKKGFWHSWYDTEYRSLNFPKCPKPIYFEFSLQEILFTFYDKCKISNGNLQRLKSNFGKIEEMVSNFNYQDLFINPGMDSEEWKKFGKFAQQEFLIENELDFSSLNYFKIICATNADRSLLINLLGEDSIDIINNLFVDESYYRNENPHIYHSVENDRIKISTTKLAEGYFILLCNNVQLLEIIEGDILKTENDKITFKSNIEITSTLNFEITIKYIDEIKQEWFILSNYTLTSTDYEEIRMKSKKRKGIKIYQK